MTTSQIIGGAPAPLLAVSGLSAGYGRIPVLSDVTLHIDRGEFLSVLGHNGMGKSTLLRTLMGYLPATSGLITFDGVDITQRSPTARARAGLGYVPQGRDIFSSLSVYENLRMGCLLNPIDETQTIEEVLGAFPRLKAYLHRAGGALSGGEQQLLALARCLCGAPRLLILDEPTEGIQPSIIEEMIATLAELRHSRNLTVLLVEQNLNFIAGLSDRILVLQKGAITAEIARDGALDPAVIREFVGMA